MAWSVHRRCPRGRLVPRSPGLGFTLIELLVVVAIIVLLAALFLPVLGSVRERANRVICASNMKQIGAAFHLYRADHDGMYSKFNTNPEGPGQESWDGFIEPYMGNTMGERPGGSYGLTPYKPLAANPFRCPSDRFERGFAGVNVAEYRSYSRVFGYSAPWRSSPLPAVFFEDHVQERLVPKTEGMVFLAEWHAPFNRRRTNWPSNFINSELWEKGWYWGGGLVVGEYPPRIYTHDGKGGNFLFFNGAVKWLNTEQASAVSHWPDLAVGP
jgi:prepilin-type N-terminal cleavage/methylation domain-containing protein